MTFARFIALIVFYAVILFWSF